VLQGEASFVTHHKLSVGGQFIVAERIIIAIGCETVVPPIEGLQEAGYITNAQAVSLPNLPRRLAIIGGGAMDTQKRCEAWPGRAREGAAFAVWGGVGFPRG